jgi:uncharacterized RDD family membrane protein YckC
MTDALETAAPQVAMPSPASVRSRALAGLIDLVPCDALIFALLWAAGQLGLLIGVIVVAAVFSVCEMRGGQTPGKRIVGLEVRYLDGTPCDGRAAVIRNAFRFLDWFPGFYAVGGFTIAGNRRRQRLGDQAAGTSVYRRSDLVTAAGDA